MPIFHDRLADQIEELLPEFYQEEGPRFVSFLKSYFEFLEKGQLIYKDAADIDLDFCLRARRTPHLFITARRRLRL